MNKPTKEAPLDEQVEEAAPPEPLAPEQTQEYWNKALEAHGWTLHGLPLRWYPPLEDGSPHLPDAEGRPTVNTTQFLHVSDVHAAIETGTTAELLAVIVKFGRPVAG